MPKVIEEETGQTWEWPNCDTADCPNLIFYAAKVFHGIHRCYPCTVRALGQKEAERLRDWKE